MGSVLYENGGSRFVFSKEDIANLVQMLRGNLGAHRGKAAEIIIELERACDESRGRPADPAFRRERLEEYYLQISKLAPALIKLMGFIRHNLDPMSDNEDLFEAYKLAGSAHGEIRRLQDWLSTTLGIEEFPSGRIKAKTRFPKGNPGHSQCAIDLARSLKYIFDHFGLRTTKRGLFSEVLCACLEAIRPVVPDSVRLPTKDPSRLIDKILKESVS